MPSIGRQFGKGEGVPHKDLALAALGLDEKGSKGFKGDRGSKGSDEIRLSAAEKHEAEKSEDIWDRDRMIVWAKTIGDDEKYNEAWVDETFEFLSNGTIRSKVNDLYLNGTQVKEIPPGLQVEVLDLSNTQVKEIPLGFQVKALYLIDTQVKEIPPGLQVKDLYLSRTQVKEIPPGLQAKRLYLIDTPVKEIPEDKGAIQKIWINSSQTELKASAEARGIEVETF